MVYRYCKSIINFGIKAQYALMDTRFYSDKLTSDLQEIGLHSICMIKKSLKFSFVDETTRYNSNKLLSALKKWQNLDSDIISDTEVQTPSGQIVKLVCNYSEPYRPKIMSGVPSKAAFNALTAFMPFFLAVPM